MLFRVFTVLAVAALVISTWILSSPSHRPSVPGGGKQAELPGYYLKHAVLTDYDASGEPSVRIEAERIDQIDHGNEVELYNVRVNYETPGGQNWLLVGDTAHVRPGGTIVDVAGNVSLQGELSASDSTPAIMHADTLTYELIFDDCRLPEGAVLVPGVVGHCTDFIEHPELVAERLVRYAKLIGRENVMAGTDCGLGPRVGHAKIAWAKLEALAQGAALATRQLWRRAH